MKAAPVGWLNDLRMLDAEAVGVLASCKIIWWCRTSLTERTRQSVDCEAVGSVTDRVDVDLVAERSPVFSECGKLRSVDE